MKYEKILPGTFISRPNRFIANVIIDGQQQIAHVKNTGRCKELLVPGAKIYVKDCRGRGRKTNYDLIAVYKNSRLINMDSMAPNKVFGEFAAAGGFLPGINYIKPEFAYGDSRFDFYIESKGKKHLVEVKGVTLEKNDIASFPDAPTKRGVKHIKELTESISHGFIPHVVFVVQMTGIKYVTPNWETHREFGEALQNAAVAGVHICAFQCAVTPDSLLIDSAVPVIISEN